MKTRLWFLRETPLARLYSKLPLDKPREKSDEIWIPRSVIEHVTKFGNEHHLTITDWWADKNDL